MSRRPLLGVLAFVTAIVAAPLTIRSQAPAPAASRGTASSTKSVRDLAPVSPESVGISTERLRRIDENMKRLVDEKQVAGLVTLLVRHGKVAHLNTVGSLDVSRPGPLRADSIFRIASMTKPVIGVAMMMLHEEGKWRLDDPVSRFIPGFRDLKVYTGSNADGTPKLEDARRPMTMRELMTHTGGLAYTLSDVNPVDKMLIQARVLNPRAPLQSMIDGLAEQ